MSSSFKIYLVKYIHGEVEQHFYLYNTLSRGPKAIPVESPKPPSNPYSVLKYSDPILKKPVLSQNDIDDICIDNTQSDDGDDPHFSNHLSFDLADAEMLDLFDLFGGRDIDFSPGRTFDENLLSDALLNEGLPPNEGSRAGKLSEKSDICEMTIHSDSLFDMDIGPFEYTIGSTPNILSLKEDGISIKSSFEGNEEDRMFIRISCKEEPSTSLRKRIRRSELNDLKPDPKKLLQIGYQISRQLERHNDLAKPCERLSKLPIKKSSKNKRTDSKRLKSQLGSRICRLKKRASLEANKVFFDALQKEQESLLLVMKTMLETLVAEVNGIGNTLLGTGHLSRLNCLVQQHLDDMAAGYRSNCVRKALNSEAKRILSENNELELLVYDSE